MIILLVAATTVIVCLSQSVCLRVSVCFCRCIYLSVSLISVNAPFGRLLSNFCETWGVSWWCGHTENKIPPPAYVVSIKCLTKAVIWARSHCSVT